jgi:DNA repair exonuclease SbcCD ATPase subunit
LLYIHIHAQHEIHSSSEDVIQNLQKETAHQLETIYDLVEKVKRAKQAISSYSLQLFDLDQSLDRLMDNTLNIQFSISKKELDLVNHQLADSITEFHADRQRIIHLQERVFVHSAFLIGARQKYDQIKKRVQNHAWYPWFYTGKILTKFNMNA